MKQTVVGIALLAAFGAAHAYDSVGDTTQPGGYLRVGPTTSTTFHGPVGAPGIGLGSGETWYISLQSISIPGFTHKQTVSGGDRYQLLGYSHSGDGGNIQVDFNWGKVATTGTDAKQVYYGLTTDQLSGETIAFYVGDKENRVVPSGDTTYATTALVLDDTTTTSTPLVLQGSLQYDYSAQTLNSVGNLTGGTNTLSITSNVSGATITGNAAYNSASNNGTVKGEFFGGGTNSGSSAVAGTIDGGTAYQAAFGGVATN